METILRCRLWQRCTIGQWKFISMAQVSRICITVSIHLNYGHLTIFHHASTLVNSDDQFKNCFMDLLVLQGIILTCNFNSVCDACCSCIDAHVDLVPCSLCFWMLFWWPLLEPINTFHGIHQNNDEPIRVSYHRNIHYNSVVNPNKATIGVGLGLPAFKPGVGICNQSLI